MQALLEQALDLLRGVWRFRWYAAAIAWAVCIVGWVFVLSLPDVYEASARVFVDPRTPVANIVQGIAFDQDVNAQLNYVQQSLLGAPLLEKVAKEADLQPAEATREQRMHLINSLRERVVLTAQGPNRGEVGGTVYTIQFQDQNRQRALKVVDTLLNTFVEDTLGGKKVGSAAAQQFLQTQIQDYEKRLRTAELRLADFKRNNVGLMPGAGGDYFTNLQAEIDAEKKAQSTLAIAVTRRGEIERQLRGELPFSTLAAATTTGGQPAQDMAARIKETQAKLDELLLRFTDKHPDVIALRETLAELQRRRESELEALRRGDREVAANSGATANPVYQNIQLSLNQADVEIAALRREISDRQVKIAELRRRINTAPEVEAEFSRLNRDYDVTKAQYVALTERLEKARIGEDAGAKGSVRFEVIDPPNAAFRPVAPKRLLLAALVLFAGLGAAGGLCFLLQQLKPVFSNTRALTEVVGLPVLGVVSMTWLERHKESLRRAYLVYSGVGLALLVVFAVVAWISVSGLTLTSGSA